MNRTLIFYYSTFVNTKQIVRHLREELQLLQEPGSYVAEVVKLMGKTKVLVKVNYLISKSRMSASWKWTPAEPGHSTQSTL